VRSTIQRFGNTTNQGATLIKPDVRISRIRLSDWLHRKAQRRLSALAPKGPHGEFEPALASTIGKVPSGENGSMRSILWLQGRAPYYQ